MGYFNDLDNVPPLAGNDYPPDQRNRCNVTKPTTAATTTNAISTSRKPQLMRYSPEKIVARKEIVSAAESPIRFRKAGCIDPNNAPSSKPLMIGMISTGLTGRLQTSRTSVRGADPQQLVAHQC